MSVIRIATRKSPLALWQAEHVQQLLQQSFSELAVKLIPMTTEGDRFLSAPLSSIGGKGLFIKELEQALIENKADIAVHSMKDVTVDFPEGLELSVIMQREDPRDAFISNQYDELSSLPQAAIVGTSSVRRQCQIRKLRPDLQIKDLRGNVGTRLAKLDEGQYDAIILAAAGIKRLGLQHRIREYISPDILLPAVGQAAIGIETRTGDEKTLSYIRLLQDANSTICVEAERAFSRTLFGGCQLPIAAHAELKAGVLSMQGLVGRIDGTELIIDSNRGPESKAESLGVQLAERLLSNGADKILRELINR